jgi:ADP-dependent phosphofructokinase/glucokinase
LAELHSIGPEDLVVQGPIRTERDLVASILAFVARSAGGERRVDEPEVIEEFCDRFDSVLSLGGTCVRSAAAMQRFGQKATVHLAFDDEAVRRLLPEGTLALVPDEVHASHPHLIVQYPAGARVTTDRLDLVASRANRLIYVNDPANEQLPLSPHLADAVAGSRVFLISGLNAMRSLPQLRLRLAHIEECIRGRAGRGLVVYEDAGFHKPEFAAVVRGHLARLVDVYSLSDEELVQAVRSLEGPGARDVSDGALDLHDAGAVLAAVSALSERLEVPVVVVHSRHWALAYGAEPARFAEALATGVALATARYAHGDGVTEATLRDILAAAPDPATAAMAERLSALAGERVACVPVPAVETAHPTTVGLGDTFVGGFLAACATPPPPSSPSTPHAVAAGKAP